MNNINKEQIYNMIVAEVLGFVGATFLSIRFIPVIFKIVNNDNEEFNLSFCILEMISCILLGISAYMYRALPFIICNSISLLFSLVIIIIHFFKRKYRKLTVQPRNV